MRPISEAVDAVVARGTEPAGVACSSAGCGAPLTRWQARSTGRCDRCNAAADASAAEQRERLRLSGFARDAGLDPAYAEFRLETFRRATPADAAALDAVLGWNAERNLVLTGPNGGGKTHLAVGALRRLHARGVRVLYFPGRPSEFAEQLRGEFGELRRGPWEALVTVPVLLLDDLAPAVGERSEKWADEHLSLLIDKRFRARRPTIVTTNRSPKTMYRGETDADGRVISQGDPKTWSRLLEQTFSTAVQVSPGSDRRLRPLAGE